MSVIRAAWGRFRGWPLWGQLVAGFLALTLLVGPFVGSDEDKADPEPERTEERIPFAPTTERRSTTTGAPITTTTSPPTTQARPTTTVAPTTTPPTTTGGGVVNAGSYCDSPGATGYETDGEPMTCSTTSCDGSSYDRPRWRRTTC